MSYEARTRLMALGLLLLVASGPLAFVGCSKASCATGESCVGDGTTTSCSTHSECEQSPEFEQLSCEGTGTLAGEARRAGYCVNGSCQVECARICSALQKSCDRTTQPGAVCRLGPIGSTTDGICSKVPIPCTSTSSYFGNGCPAERPGEGDWACVDGFCRFPGFRYAHE